jgi:hypothetical protein
MGRFDVRVNHRIDVGVVPHVERARCARPDCDAQQRREGDHRMHMPRRDHETDQRREDDKRHDPGLHQRHIVTDALAMLGSWRTETTPLAENSAPSLTNSDIDPALTVG